MLRNIPVLLVTVLLISASTANAQTTYQDAMKIHALRDAFGADGITSEEVLTAYENLAENASFGNSSATAGAPAMPASGGVEDRTATTPATTPGQQQKFTGPVRKRMLARVEVERKWISELIRSGTMTEAEFVKLISSRPAHFEFLNAMLLANGIDPRSVSGTGLNAASLLGFDEAKIINGITSWAMKQAQAELMQAFMKQWLDKLSENRYLSLMMPTTLNTIKTSDLGALISNGALWKSSFQHDLDAVPSHSDSLVALILRDIHKKDTPTAIYDEIGSSALLFGEIYRGIGAGKDLETIISTEAYRTLMEQPVLPVSGSVGYALTHRALAGSAALLEATRIETDGKFKGHVDPMVLLRMDSITFHDYWKFICVAHAPMIKLALKIDDAALMQLAEQKYKVGTKVFAAREHLLGLVENAQAISALMSPDGNAEKRKLDAAKTLQFASAIMSLLDNGFDLALVADPSLTSVVDGKVRPVLKDLMRVDAAVIAQDYGGALSGLIDLGERFILIDTARNDAEKLKKFTAGINKYGNFMVDILTADSSSNVEDALRKATAGTGGYRVKLTSHAAATVSLFPGVFGGMETVRSADRKRKFTDPALGAYLPIGLALTAGTNCKIFPDIGLYLQAVDLGAVLNYRLNSNDSVATSPAYNFKMLLSPGAYITTHLGRSPLVFGFGANVTPALREVTGATLNTQADAVRWGFFLGVDVTAFQLAASRKKFGDSSGTYRDMVKDH